MCYRYDIITRTRAIGAPKVSARGVRVYIISCDIAPLTGGGAFHFRRD